MQRPAQRRPARRGRGARAGRGRGRRHATSASRSTIAVRRVVRPPASGSSRRRATCGSRSPSGCARQGSPASRSRIRHGPTAATLDAVPGPALRAQAEARRTRQRRRHRAGRRSSPRSAWPSLAVVGAVGFGAGAALSASCSLSSLKPVNIGANTFVYAADGSLLGSIPADRNREPVSPPRMSAVAAEGDRRGRGQALLRARRRRLRRHPARALGRRQRRQGRRGRLDDQPAARPEHVHGPRADVRPQDQGGLPRDQAQRPLVEVRGSSRPT